jgi:hypothetical protein
MALPEPFTRRDFQALSWIHLRAARSLRVSRQWQNAYHVAGYAAECALKACIAKRTRRHDFPRRDTRDVYTHNLTALVAAAELDVTLRAALQASKAFEVNWTTVKDWTPESRYDLLSIKRRHETFTERSRPNRMGS